VDLAPAAGRTEPAASARPAADTANAGAGIAVTPPSAGANAPTVVRGAAPAPLCVATSACGRPVLARALAWPALTARLGGAARTALTAAARSAPPDAATGVGADRPLPRDTAPALGDAVEAAADLLDDSCGEASAEATAAP